MSNDRRWMAPLTGVVFIVLAIVSIFVGGEPPDAEDPAAKIVEHYTDNKDSVMIGAALGAVASTFLVFFASYLRSLFRDADGRSGTLANAILAGGTIMAIGIAIDGTISFALAENADDIDPTGAQTLLALWQNDFLPMGLGVQVLMIATGLSVLRHGILPKAIAWLALLLGVLVVTPVGFVGFLGSLLLILIISVMLTVRERKAGTTGPATPAAPTPDPPPAA